jgi:hypothetical protein
VIPFNRGRIERPQHRELSKKLRDCLDCVKEGRWFPADPGKLKANFDELEEVFGIETSLWEDQRAIMVAILGEITANHYAGAYPPQRSYEGTILKKELFAFCWPSEYFNRREMYFKFCMVGGDASKRVFICSIHPSRDNND